MLSLFTGCWILSEEGISAEVTSFLKYILSVTIDMILLYMVHAMNTNLFSTDMF